ncbi:hypothetical protein ANO14919_040500 [Xylariales sp. No.14919]|nr:hypothetical protein ANO14919_040500 [Xylariales sp. No.14919]
MAEVSGLLLGAVSVLTSLKGTLDTALLIEFYLDDEKLNCSYLALRYHIQKTRLDLWRRVYNIDDISACPLRKQPEIVQRLVIQILGQINQLFDESKRLVDKHNINTPVSPAANVDGTPRPQDAVIAALSKIRVKPKAKFLWTIKGKAEFEEKVSNINTLIDDLEGFTVNASESQSLQRALPSMGLKHITNTTMLHTLLEPNTRVDSALATSARVKLLQSNFAKSPESSATVLTIDQLRFLQNSSTLGTLRSTAMSFTPVWIEWSVVSDGTAAPEYIRRIKALGYLLEKASDPVLRLPVCHGIFDDLAYEAEFGARRIGYVFSAPQAGHNSTSSLPVPAPLSLPTYGRNFRDHPPRTLSDLIKDKSFPVPLLGDRFTLAFTLATAFSYFHSAGWLHKGFHSGNIIFLAQDSGQEGAIRATDPFITGFQYSRPADSHSLSRGPLENSDLEHYYHPSAEKGFSRRIDLYSLGVVLCEIGRWGLVRSTVPDQARRKMVDRVAWRNYLVRKVLADIGWRMGEKYQSAVRTLLECQLPDDENGNSGEFFEQEYFEKVIRPLSACSA